MRLLDLAGGLVDGIPASPYSSTFFFGLIPDSSNHTKISIYFNSWDLLLNAAIIYRE